MNVKDYDYDLPEELIAQDPLEDRSSSRLMVLDRQTGDVEHRHFTDILEYLHPGDCLVINNTKVIPARLFGVKEDTQAKIEVLLLKRKENDIWETLVKPGKKAKPGTKLVFGDGLLTAEVVDVVEEGNRLIQFHYDGIFEEILDLLGQMPLPPYITHQLKDKNRYQTVYAKYDGSAAAPTAGLHFTKELLQKVKDMGVDIAEVTLHVGLGTFRPVKVEDVFIKPTLEGATFDLTAKNHGSKKSQFDLYTDVIDKETGSLLYSGLSLPKLILNAGEEKVFTYSVNNLKPRLWTPHHPNLYDFRFPYFRSKRRIVFPEW